MKKVNWPEPVTIDKQSVTVLSVFENLVFARPHSREGKNASLALDIWTKLENENPQDLTDEECEMLIRGLELRGEAIAPPTLNRFVLKVLRALNNAETV